MSTSSIQIPRHGALLLLPWFVLLVFGTIMVGSSSVAMAGDYVTRQLVNLCVSIFLLVICLLYTSPSPRDCRLSRMPSSA